MGWFDEHQDELQAALAKLESAQLAKRILEQDFTVWSAEPDEIADRLAWLDCPAEMTGGLSELAEFSLETREDGITDIVLLGMGGSSLAPEVLAAVLGSKPGCPRLTVLDSTAPASVQAVQQRSELGKVLFVVATKSGGTVETLSLFKYFYNMALDEFGADGAGRHFTAITDPGSQLAKLAKTLGFRRLFLNDAEIGGRYSALSYFGLVPASLICADCHKLLQSAAAILSAERGGIARRGMKLLNSVLDLTESGGSILGAIIGLLATSGYDKLTFIASPRASRIIAWIEQLMAESTGKEGKGILPVDGGAPGSPAIYGADRAFVHIYLEGDEIHTTAVNSLAREGFPVIRLRLSELEDLGGEFMRWEMATAVACHYLGVNPFNQPDVESSKIRTRRLVDEYRTTGKLPIEQPDLEEDGVRVYGGEKRANPADSLAAFLSEFQDGGYFGIQVFAAQSPDLDDQLNSLSHLLRDWTGLAATVGYGPRFLHSTGQLHKGGLKGGRYLQLVECPTEDLPIPDEPGKPESSISFGALMQAQAMGDRHALIEAGRRVWSCHFSSVLSDGLRGIIQKLEEIISRN